MNTTLQPIIDYIEDNLTTDLTPHDLANMSGYSLFYFYRLFQQATGLPIMQYLTKRRLIHGIYDIQNGKKMVDAALMYGFGSYSGFLKAFKKEYGLSPSHYLKYTKVSKPYPIQLEKEVYKMMSHINIKSVLQHWGLNVDSISPVVSPNSAIASDHVWEINHCYFLKMFSDQETLNKNLVILNQLDQTQDFLLTKDRQSSICYNDHFFVLLKKISGVPFLSSSIFDNSHEELLIGKMIGQISILLKEVTGDFPKTNLVETVTKWALPKARVFFPGIQYTLDNKINEFKEIYPTLPTQLIHRDLHGANMLIHTNGMVLIDYDLAEYTIRLFDPCYFLTSILSEQFNSPEYNEQVWFELVKDVFNGFQQVTPLTKDEIKAIPYVMISIQLVAIAYFSDFDKYQDLLKINCDITDWLIKNWHNLAL